MPRQTTYGFEAEWQTNAQSVIQGLHALELSGDSRLHGYHCDCDNCLLRNGFPFRGQTDSSCSGEIISDIFGSNPPPEEGAYITSDLQEDPYPNSRELMDHLCEVAVDCDAEPGLNSGFHVHVGTVGLTAENLYSSFTQFIRWESVFTRIAGGRWTTQREGMNTTVRQSIRWAFESSTGRHLDGELSNRALHAAWEAGAFTPEAVQYMFREHQSSDRHSNLNLRQSHHPTWEFRMWNSTRAGWRMEMFCELSKAMMDPAFVAHLATLNPPQRFRRPSGGIGLVQAAAAATDYPVLAEHLARQATYLDQRAADAPQSLTTL